MRSRKTTGLLAAFLVFAAAALPARAELPAVLKQVPQDAKFVLVIKNLKSLSTQISNYAAKLHVPGNQDLLTEFSNNMGISQGLDANGSLAVVGVSTADDAGPANGTPPMVILIPATDTKAMLDAFKPGTAENGISTVTINNEEGFASTVDKFVILAQTKDALTKYLAHKNTLDADLPKNVAAAFENNDAVLYANMPQIAKEVLPQLDGMKNMMQMFMPQQGGAEQSAAATAMIDLYFDAFKQYMTDADVGLVGAKLNDTGATLAFTGIVKDASTTGKLFAAQKPLKGSPIEGLPADPYLVAGALAWDSASFADLAAKVTTAVVNAKDPNAGTTATDPKTPDNDKAKKMADVRKQIIGLTTGARFVLIEPPAGAKGLVHGAYILDTTDPDKYLTLTRQSAKDSIGLATRNSNLKPDVQITETATTVRGVKFDKMTVKFSLKKPADGEPPISDADRTAFDQVNAIYGPDGFVSYFGKIGKQIVASFGPDDTLLDKIVDAAQTKATGLSTQISAEIQKQVVENPIAVAFLPIDHWAEFANRRRQEMTNTPAHGANKPVAMGGATPPMVLSLGTTATSGTLQIHVPANTIIAISEFANRMHGSADAPNRGDGAQDGPPPPNPPAPQQ